MNDKTTATATGAKLHVFNYTATFLGDSLAAIVGGSGADMIEAMADAAARLHALGYQDVTLAPRTT